MSEYVGFKAGKEIEWLELNLLKNKKPISKSKILGLAEDIDEDDVDGWLTELENRCTLYNQPIYEVINNKIIPHYSWEEIPEYFLCVFYSFYGANDNSGGTSIFERISGEALKNFLNGDVYTFGFPSGRGFNSSLDDVAQLCSEIRNLRADSSYKDDGVDVLAYKSFGDKRSSNLYVLLQCAAGKHWSKKKPINMNNWTNYLVWYRENIIQSISTVDFVKEKFWMKHSSTFGMLLDRLRIFNCLYGKDINAKLRQEVWEWCDAKIKSGI